MDDPSNPPILDHPVDEGSAFTAEALIDDVRRLRDVSNAALPVICFLKFDGDLTDWLVQQRIAAPFDSWACFHSQIENERTKPTRLNRPISYEVGGDWRENGTEEVRA